MYNIYIYIYMSLFISIYLGGVLFSQKRWLDGLERERGSWPILACRYSIHPLHQLRWQAPASSILPIIQGFVCRLSWLLPVEGWRLDTHWLQFNRVHWFTVCLLSTTRPCWFRCVTWWLLGYHPFWKLYWVHVHDIYTPWMLWEAL